MRSHNPVLTRLTPETQTGYREPVSYGQETAGYQSPQVVAPADTERMTIDDVVVRTVGLLVLTGLSAAVAWNMVGTVFPVEAAGPLALGAAMVGLVLGLIISFKRVTNPALIGAYAIVEGVFVGIISKFFEARCEGIVVQAVIGTFGVFLIMALLYKSRVIRATPRFTRIIVGALVGVFALMLVNLVLSLFGVNLGLRDGGPTRHRVQPRLHRGRGADLRARLRPDRGGCAPGHAQAVRLVVRVRHPGRPDLAVPGDPAPAQLPAGRQLTWSNRPTQSERVTLP